MTPGPAETRTTSFFQIRCGDPPSATTKNGRFWVRVSLRLTNDSLKTTMSQERLQRNRESLPMYIRFGKTGVSQGLSVLRFGAEPPDKRFNSVSCVLSTPLQALVSSLGADVSHAPHVPQITMLRNNCTIPFPNTSRFTRCFSRDSISLRCLSVEVQFFIVCLKRTTVAERVLVIAGPLRDCRKNQSSCRASIVEHFVDCCFPFGRLLALPHVAHRKISRLLHLLLIACLADARVIFCCLVLLWTGVRGGKNSRLDWAEHFLQPKASHADVPLFAVTPLDHNSESCVAV